MMVLRAEAVPGEAGSNPPASRAPEPRLWGAARRIDKAELRVQSVCFFCPEQWRLEYGLGLEPGNRAALDAGDRHHAQKAVGGADRGRVHLPWGGWWPSWRSWCCSLLLVVVMSLHGRWIAVAAVLALLLGLVLVLVGRGMRQRRGLGGAKRFRWTG